MLDVATELLYEGDNNPDTKGAKADYEKALEVLDLIDKNLGEQTSSYGLSIGSTLGQLYGELGDSKRLNNDKLTEKGKQVLWNMLEKYAPYLAYNREMAINFGNPSLTPESRLIPYQYYRFVELYEQFGGDEKKVDELVGRYGLSVEELRKNYERLYGNGGGDYVEATPEAGSATIDQYAEEIAKYCEIANELSKLDGADYAARSQDERLIDSMLWKAMEYYRSVGGTEEALKKYDNYNRLDKERTKRLSEEYARSHPELGM